MAEQKTGEGKRYYFRRRQFVLMAVGFSFAALIIYFLGILTGIKIGGKGFVESESPAKTSAQAVVKEPPPSGDTDAGSEPPPTQDESLKPSPGQPTAGEPAQDKTVADKSSKTETEVVASLAKEPTLAPSKRTTQSVSPATAPKAVAQNKTGPSQGDKPKESRPTWTVQVKAFPDEASADVWVYALKAKGYDTYRIAVDIEGKKWHRVRAGRFVDQNEAESLRKTLVSKEGLKDAFLARE